MLLAWIPLAICRDNDNRDNPFIRRSLLAIPVVKVTHLSTYQKPVLDLEVLEPKSKKAEFDKTLLWPKLLYLIAQSYSPILSVTLYIILATPGADGTGSTLGQPRDSPSKPDRFNNRFPTPDLLQGHSLQHQLASPTTVSAAANSAKQREPTLPAASQDLSLDSILAMANPRQLELGKFDVFYGFWC